MARVTPDFITTLQPNEIFVFGSNLAGMHGGGAAHVAYKLFGAQWGVGVGPTGQCYAIPTMQGGVETIKPYVDEFIAYARQHTELTFLVTRIGCGIAGFTDEEIAPLFAAAHNLTNVVLPHGWREMRKQVEVVAAVIFDEQGRIFATQRGYGEWKDWWEFPGGKIEAGETPQEVLKREIREELEAEIEVSELMKTIDYDYPKFHLTMHCFKCRLMGSVTLKEHEAAKWLAPKDLQSVKWLPADEDFIYELIK